MDAQTRQAITQYAQAYQQLYQRIPADIRTIESGWVLVNGARMRVAELEYLTQQLQLEHSQELARRRGVVRRLLAWFKQ
jgi:hypothetical protein